MLGIDLGIPKEIVFEKFMPKKHFYENRDFSTGEKNLFINNIEKIVVYSQLTRENSNIDLYEDSGRNYKIVSIIVLELRKKDDLEKLASLIMNTIPSLVILIGKYEEEFIFFGAHFKDNKVDKEKIILEKIYNTGFINSDSYFIEDINYKNLSKTNLFKFYSDYLDTIISFNLEKRNLDVSKIQENKGVLEKLEKLEKDIETLKNKMKSEKQFNKKMDLNIKIKKLEEELKKVGK